jgi:putative SOS response-associated peptidase YedK
MCGRFALFTDVVIIAELFEAAQPTFPWEPRYNIAPTQGVIACRLALAGEGASARELVLLRWGLIPSWSKDPSGGAKAINARAETVAEKPAFRSAFKQRRCLIPASGFYEWKKMGKAKQPYFIHGNHLLTFAGLWETWTGNDETIESCSILTTAAAGPMEELHERMPVILAPSTFAAWLDPRAESADLVDLVRPTVELSMHPVGERVGNVRNEGADLIKAVGSQFLF